MNTLLSYDLPEARRSVLGLFPELRRAVAVEAVIVYLTNNELLDTESQQMACDIAKTLWAYVGLVQETRRDTFGIGQRLALARLKQGVRDACLTMCWPGNRAGGVYHLELSQNAVVALGRLRRYDRLQGPSSYTGDMAGDVLALADGVTPQRARTT